MCWLIDNKTDTYIYENIYAGFGCQWEFAAAVDSQSQIAPGCNIIGTKNLCTLRPGVGGVAGEWVFLVSFFFSLSLSYTYTHTSLPFAMGSITP